ncbi:hypothetical protein A4X06_0g6319 [Tilletia controversa]|uniref:Uncharacterized protein n=1 Tax=Tilletia controversa TaxID=13291 RepID=A0A8X7SV35_9BASI|nr:hypothetical protein CF328_g8090 [Tilletia controversa]KAE8243431.1 hypothetical protein A4X06_0g6319 [Tilletia controversa]
MSSRSTRSKKIADSQRNTKKAALLPAAEVALGVVSSAVAAAAAASVLPVSNDQQMQQQQRQQQQEQQQQPQLQQPTPLAQHDSSPPARTELGGIDGAARDAAVFEMQKEPISSSTSLLASNASMAPASSGRLSVEASAPPAQQTAGEFSNDSFLGTNSSAPRHNHESTGDPSNEEEEDENGMPKMGEGEKMNEKASRLLWLSTMDALDYLEKEEDWKYIFDDRKRARIVREKYWRMVRDAAIFSRRTGVEIFLAAGRPNTGNQGMKQHVFVSAGLCNPDNKTLHDAAEKMSDIWTRSLAACREALIAQNKEKDDLIQRQQAQFLADQRRIQDQELALNAALAAAAGLREANERLLAAVVGGAGEGERSIASNSGVSN